ncbi:PREDICTED: CLK4-associating serine/arginine rich protein-like, partial [Chrysochloris asiatica]|uniref:CLK4-associating serine/arginine rich protein-like n=1 Tax=Chrysochloris asiatica TaxID=185453 RepID=A0A9B0X371_CHRAS
TKERPARTRPASPSPSPGAHGRHCGPEGKSSSRSPDAQPRSWSSSRSPSKSRSRSAEKRTRSASRSPSPKKAAGRDKDAEGRVRQAEAEAARARRRSRSYSPIRKRRRDSPSFMEPRRITRLGLLFPHTGEEGKHNTWIWQVATDYYILSGGSLMTTKVTAVGVEGPTAAHAAPPGPPVPATTVGAARRAGASEPRQTQLGCLLFQGEARSQAPRPWGGLHPHCYTEGPGPAYMDKPDSGAFRGYPPPPPVHLPGPGNKEPLQTQGSPGPSSA